MISLHNIFIGNERSVKVKKNLLASIVFKVADTLIYFLLIPLTLGYISSYEYGIWLTLSSLLIWIDSLDIGLGNGLRNKLAVTIAIDDKEKGREYVSTTFFMLILISVVILIIVTIISYSINWYSLLNVNHTIVNNLHEVIYVALLFWCLNFVLKFIQNVYQAYQKTAISNMIIFGGHLFSLIVIFILKKCIPGDLLIITIVFSASLPLTYILLFPVTFFKVYPHLLPSVRYFRRNSLKELFGLSMIFFAIQICGIVLFSTSNIFISYMYGPDSVTPYNIAYRYFSSIFLFYNLLLAPIWSASTDAYVKKDYVWLRNAEMKIRKILFLLLFVFLFMYLISDFVYKIWIGNKVIIIDPLSQLMALYFFLGSISLSYASFLNGMGKLQIQLFIVLVSSICFIPLCYFLQIYMGIVGVLLGMCIFNMIGAIVFPIQLHKILNSTAKGLWQK